MDFKIEEGVPIPDDRAKYPIAEMSVGTSFIFPLDKRNSVATLASKYRTLKGWKFTIKRINDKEGRIWRLK